MSLFSSVNSTSYVSSLMASASQKNEQGQADFAALLKDSEKTAESTVAPAITGLLGGGSSSSMAVIAEASSTQEDEESLGDNSAVKAFREYMDQTPEERMFTAMLGKRGYTQEQYDALPPEEKLKLQKEIQDEMRQMYEQKVTTGKSATSSVEEMAQQTAGVANRKSEDLFG